MKRILVLVMVLMISTSAMATQPENPGNKNNNANATGIGIGVGIGIGGAGGKGGDAQAINNTNIKADIKNTVSNVNLNSVSNKVDLTMGQIAISEGSSANASIGKVTATGGSVGAVTNEGNNVSVSDNSEYKAMPNVGSYIFAGGSANTIPTAPKSGEFRKFSDIRSNWYTKDEIKQALNDGGFWSIFQTDGIHVEINKLSQADLKPVEKIMITAKYDNPINQVDCAYPIAWAERSGISSMKLIFQTALEVMEAGFNVLVMTDENKSPYTDTEAKGIAGAITQTILGKNPSVPGGSGSYVDSYSVSGGAPYIQFNAYVMPAVEIK